MKEWLMTLNRKTSVPAALLMLFTPSGAVAQSSGRAASPDLINRLDELKFAVAGRPECASPTEADSLLMVCGMGSIDTKAILDNKHDREREHRPAATATVLFPDAKAWMGDLDKLEKIVSGFEKNPQNQGIVLRLYPSDELRITAVPATGALLVSGEFINHFPVDKVIQELNKAVHMSKKTPPGKVVREK